MTSPSFQFYAADYLSDENVQLMTLEEEGAYIRLLSFCWREGSIPADVTMLQRLCKGASEMVIRVVTKCFKRHPENGERLIHPRLEEEREKQKKWKEKSSEGGRKSAAKRWGSEGSEENKGGYKMVQPNGNSSTSSSNIIPPIVPQGGCEGDSDDSKQQKPSKPEKAKREKPEPSETGLAFADWFKTQIPDSSNLTSTWREDWGRCYDEMIRLDGRTKEQIFAVCRFARGDESFWKQNLLSPLKLRKRKDGVMYFDLLLQRVKTSHPSPPTIKKLPGAEIYDLPPREGEAA